MGDVDQGFRGIRIERERLGEQLLRLIQIRVLQAIEVPAAAPQQIGDVRVRRHPFPRARPFAVIDLGAEMRHQLLQAFVERGRNHRSGDLDPFGPDRLQSRRLIERDVDPHQVCRGPDRAVEEIFGAQPARFVAGDRRNARTAGVAGDHRQPSHARQAVDQFLLEAFGEIGVVRIARQVCKAQDRQRGAVAGALSRPDGAGLGLLRRRSAGGAALGGRVLGQARALLAQPVFKGFLAGNVDPFEELAGLAGVVRGGRHPVRKCRR